MQQTCADALLEIEGELVKIVVNVETLERIHKQLTVILPQLKDINNKGLAFQLLQQGTMEILEELLFYTVKDLRENCESITNYLAKLNPNET